SIDRVLERLKTQESACIDRLVEWLTIASISTDPAYAVEVKKAAQWAADHLRASGFSVEVHPTGDPSGSGHPVVLATCPGAADYKGPHVLFYGHYDVQPVDPLELWESPPFSPVIRDGEPGGPGRRIVARGAVDDKGQVSTFLEAMRAYKDVTGEVGGGVRFTVLLEGEEESGSVNLERFVRDKQALLKDCDVCLISDTGMLGRGKPAITYGVRGLAYTEITLHGPDQDLHSGLWGGRVTNPNAALAKVLAQLWDDQGRVTIDGFYDDVRPLHPAEREAWRKLDFDPAAALKKIGLPPDADAGEAGYSPLEREWARPTAEINGMWGGYTGAGAKTVIPSKASAKVSFRLVADQDPAKIAQKFFQWLRRRTPPGFRFECTDLHGGAPVTLPTESVYLRAAGRAIERAAGSPPALIKTGGSIPIAGLLKTLLGLDTIFMGFGLDDDRVHSPNEKFEIECWRLGARSHALLIDELRRM
ncbi:MAG: M20/M25/M40 family metallo-hydrolase, partial [Phycisphaeraceae bacterium]|nr:M20/M25/M40 family metallo-hydrolase [Phycisphaeraceae bacterium]